MVCPQFNIFFDMNGFGLVNLPYQHEDVPRFYTQSPAIIEGAEAIETLCPVSSLTGHRTNVLSLLGMVTDANARLIDSVLTELPAVRQLNVPDSVKIEQLVPAEFGTFAERDVVIQKLESIADVLFLKKQPESASKPASEPATQPGSGSVTTT